MSSAAAKHLAINFPDRLLHSVLSVISAVAVPVACSNIININKNTANLADTLNAYLSQQSFLKPVQFEHSPYNHSIRRPPLQKLDPL